MPRQKKPPKKRSVEMEINANGRKKHIVATDCTIKSPLLSRLGFGKKREVLACKSVDIIDPDGEQEAPDDQSMPEPVETDDDDESIDFDAPQQERDDRSRQSLFQHRESRRIPEA